MIQLIATDMDGTLLGSEAKITDDNARAIRDAQAEGFKVVVATGREYASASELLAEKKIGKHSNDLFKRCSNAV
ncbi:phosphatase YwpJ [Brochothrix thermosphacta DSM 20171 = FSL F6-1036]|nr:phosphatase YwpJ [Brochothrix thermosphacta DSM 20171 = FSL F6-1036]